MSLAFSLRLFKLVVTTSTTTTYSLLPTAYYLPLPTTYYYYLPLPTTYYYYLLPTTTYYLLLPTTYYYLLPTTDDGCDYDGSLSR